MGQVCAKNDAGTVTTDGAAKPIAKKKDLSSLPASATAEAPAQETQFVSAGLDFNIDKGVDKKPDALAQEAAEQWCAQNDGWEYTGQWKNE